MNKTEMLEYGIKVIFILVFMTAAIFLWSCAGHKKEPKRVTSVVHPEWSRNAAIYEVNIRQYTPEGTFAAFEEHLPRLKEMGVDILWLIPIHPIGIENRKGTLGSYYAVKDYLAVNPEFGTLSDFRSLVSKAHDLGMYIIIDWVANHTSRDNNLVKEHPDWYTHDSTGKIIAPVPDWTDVADLNYDREELREYMKNALIYWVKETDIDGFRCDVAGMLPVDFWNRVVPEIKKVKPVFILAEDETPKMHDTAFDMTYSWGLFHLMNGIAKGQKTANQIDSLWNKEDSTYPVDAYRMRFTSNHDENSWNGTEYERMGDGAQTFAVLTFTVPGMPLIYTGQEAALNKRLKFFDKDTIDWGDYKLSAFYTRLIALKKENKALWNGSAGGPLVKIHTHNAKEIYAFMRKKDGNKVVVILNLSPKTQTVNMHDHNFLGDFRDVFTNEEVHFEDVAIFNLKPWEYRVLVKQ